MSLEIIPTLFAPGQVEKITGVSVDRQRDYRRHGFLPKVEGHARFDAYEMAALFFVNAMAARGIGPQVAFTYAHTCATAIVWHALGRTDAYDREAFGILTARNMVPQVAITDDELNALRATISECGFSADKVQEVASREGLRNGREAEFLQRYISGMYHNQAIPAEYFVLWADGSEYWTKSLDEAFDDIAEADPRRAGPVTVLPLASMGAQLVLKCQLPLFTFKAS